MTEIIEVKTPRDLDDFITLPSSLYYQDLFFVPPLIMDMRERFSRENPFFLHAKVKYFLAKHKGKLSGRIASIVNYRHNEFHDDKVGFFGFFESAKDYAVSSSLLDAVSQELRRDGRDTIRGPMNFSTNEECGFLIEEFNQPPLLMTPYNPPYYGAFVEGYGMEKAKDLYAYICDIPEELPEKILRGTELDEKGGRR